MTHTTALIRVPPSSQLPAVLQPALASGVHGNKMFGKVWPLFA
jgi:hypothetical protein